MLQSTELLGRSYQYRPDKNFLLHDMFGTGDANVSHAMMHVSDHPHTERFKGILRHLIKFPRALWSTALCLRDLFRVWADRFWYA